MISITQSFLTGMEAATPAIIDIENRSSQLTGRGALGIAGAEAKRRAAMGVVRRMAVRRAFMFDGMGGGFGF